MSRRALIVAALIASAGCKNVGKCRSGTVLLKLTLLGAAANADQLVINVTVDDGPPKTTKLDHNAGQSGTIEVDFAPYPAGHAVMIDVAAWIKGVEIADNSTPVNLPSGCGTAALTLSSSFADLSGNADAAGDGSVPPTCSDGIMDVGETDVDCGGLCPPCANGKGCAVKSDCQSHSCNLSSMTCAASDCQDGVRDDAETDVDCGGGTCPGCATGQACKAAGDCSNMICNIAQMICVASTCNDGVLDGTETDIDCGGGCTTKCKEGQSCLSTTDCASPGACDATHHCVAAQCTNGVKDVANPSATPPIAAETDIDCGGTVCAPCALNKMCLAGSDCTSGFCNAITHVCVADQCHDGVKDGSESDVDCGGGTCAKCNNGQMCSGPADCGTAGSECDGAHLCCTPNCSGKVCGSDGCGSSCGSCTNATLPQCNGAGTACVCTASSCPGLLSCNGGGTCSCATGTTENCFNGVDDDCDGLVDCADPQCGSSVAVCVPTAPGGFSYGYVTSGSCPGTSVTMIQSISSPSSCTGCGGCGASGTCTTVIQGVTASGNCSSTLNTSVTVSATYPTQGTCAQNINLLWTATHAVFDAPTWSGGCSPSGSPQKPTLNITYAQFCVTNQVGGGCGAGSVCVPAGNNCVEGSGSCSGTAVTGYNTSYDDSGRGCTSCSGCSVASAGACTLASSAFVTTYASTDCSGSGDNFFDSGPSYCVGATSYHSARQSVGSGVAPTCSGTPTSSVTGSASLTGPVTVCCH